MNSKFNTLIKNAVNIAIFTHTTPDADALGGALALQKIIHNNFEGKNVDIFADGEISELYVPMLRDEQINPIPLNEYDIGIIVDSPNPQRTGKFTDIINSLPQLINIDHHETNSRFGHVNYVTTKVSSTCEMIYLLAEKHGYYLDTKTAQALFQGIITDTNNLSAVNNKNTLRVVHELLKHNFNAEKIKEYYFQRNSRAKTKLLAKALQTLRFYNNDHITTMKISYDMLNKHNATFKDTLGIIDNGINIDGIEASAILIEQEPNQVHVSLRSKGKINMGDIATNFGGGGSLLLAAFQKNGNMLDIEDELIKYLSSLLPEEDLEDSEEITFE